MTPERTAGKLPILGRSFLHNRFPVLAHLLLAVARTFPP